MTVLFMTLEIKFVPAHWLMKLFRMKGWYRTRKDAWRCGIGLFAHREGWYILTIQPIQPLARIPTSPPNIILTERHFLASSKSTTFSIIGKPTDTQIYSTRFGHLANSTGYAICVALSRYFYIYFPSDPKNLNKALFFFYLALLANTPPSYSTYLIAERAVETTSPGVIQQ